MDTKRALVLALYALCLIQLAACQSSGARLFKRQAASLQTNIDRPAPSVSVSATNPGQASSLASSFSSSSSLPLQQTQPSGTANAGLDQLDARPQRPAPVSRPLPVVPTVGGGQDDLEEPTRRPPRRRPSNRPSRKPAKPPRVRPSRPVNEYEEETADDDECDDYETLQADYGHNVFEQPMHQISRMVGDMFDHMHGLASGDYDSLPDGSNVAVASSFSDQEGENSRMASIVRNNGRTRGIVRESRNGQVQTRRIGDQDNGDDDNDE